MLRCSLTCTPLEMLSIRCSDTVLDLCDWTQMHFAIRLSQLLDKTESIVLLLQTLLNIIHSVLVTTGAQKSTCYTVIYSMSYHIH